MDASVHLGAGMFVAADVHYLASGGARAAAIAVRRGTSARPLYVTAAGMPRADAADLIRHMAGPHRIPDALRRADTLARHGLPLQ